VAKEFAENSSLRKREGKYKENGFDGCDKNGMCST
jgi:hypothetical protein